MRIGREVHWARLALLVGAFLVAAQACTLNPQPIPPGADRSGEGASAFSDAGGKRGDSSTSIPPFQGADGGNEDNDAAPPSPALDSGVDALEGGSDASLDATADAPTDAADDAPTDAGSD